MRETIAGTMAKTRAWTLIPLLALGTALMDCSCDFFGTTGALLIPESKEEELGKTFDDTLRHSAQGKAEFPIFVPANAAEAEFETYVKGLADSVLRAIPRRERPGYGFTFTIIRKDVENAFAVPGGYVYIYTGIIKKMQDESELVGVLGHEIAHVTRHHYRDALAKQASFSLLVQALMGNDAGKLAQLVAGSLVGLASLRVSQDNEKEADEYGTLYEAAVGRNPLGIAKYFARVKGSGIPWFSTHPDPGDRVEDVTAQVNASPQLKALADTSRNYTAQFLSKTQVVR
jgi:predicted Zn-dependent protease